MAGRLKHAMKAHETQYNDSDEDFSIQTAADVTPTDMVTTSSSAGAAAQHGTHREGIRANDGTFITADANGHIDLDKLHDHTKTLHTAMYVDEAELDALDALDAEYAVEEADAADHVPFSHVELHHKHIVDFEGVEGLDPAYSATQREGVDSDPDHYEFHKEHEEGLHDHRARDLLLKGIGVAQRQNDQGLVLLYRGQTMMLEQRHSDAIVQLESALEHYRHLNLARCGDEDSVHINNNGSANGSSSVGSGSGTVTATKITSRMTPDEKAEIAAEDARAAEERDRLDFCPHIYSMLVECYYNSHHYHRANSVAREWTKKYPKNVSPYQSLAWCQAEQNQTSDAISTCTDCIKKLPETEGMMTIYSIRGKCYLKMERFGEAVSDFKYVKEMSQKNLSRFAPVKIAFMSVDKASRPPNPLFVPKSRPDITQRNNRLRNAGMNNCMLSPAPFGPGTSSNDSNSANANGGSGLHSNSAAYETQRQTQTMSGTLYSELGGSPFKKGKQVHLESVRNYDVNTAIGRICSKCQPRKDPVTRRSVTKMKMGLSTDDRRGASPSRILIGKNPGYYY